MSETILGPSELEAVNSSSQGIVITPTGGDPLELAVESQGTGIFLDAETKNFLPVPDYEEEYAEGPDSEGGPLIRSVARNPEGEGRVIVSARSLEDFNDRLETWERTVEAVRRAALRYGVGGTLAYTRNGSVLITYELVSFRVAEAEQDGLSVKVYIQPYDFSFTCRPYGLLPREVNFATVSGATPVVELDVDDPGGTVPALVDLRVVDDAGEPRKWVDVGQESPATSADLLIEGADLDISDTAATSVSDSAAYNTTAVELANLLPSWRTFFYRPPVTVDGRFKVRGRLRNVTGEAGVRLAWRQGASPWQIEDTLDIPEYTDDAYAEYELADITVDEDRGDLELRVDACGSFAATVRADFLRLAPAHRYAQIRGGATISPPTEPASVADDFRHDAGSDLDTTNAPIDGSAWDSSGSGAFVLQEGGGALRKFDDGGSGALDSGGRHTFVNTASPLTSTTLTASVEAKQLSSISGESVRVGIVARYVDANNWIYAALWVKKANSGNRTHLVLVKRVAGSVTVIETVQCPTSLTTKGQIAADLELTITPAGDLEATVRTAVLNSKGVRWSHTIEHSHSQLATGGALDDGRVGIYAAATRAGNEAWVFDIAAYAAVPPGEDDIYAIPEHGHVALNHDRTYSVEAASDGGDPSPVVLAEGGRFLIDPGMDHRFAVAARRKILDEDRSTGLTDAITVEADVTRRVLLLGA